MDHITVQQFMETEEYQHKKLGIQNEINAIGKLSIDRTCFAKTQLELEKLQDMKKSFIRLKKNPELHHISRLEYIKAILDSDTPNWGSVNLCAKGL